MLAGGCLCGSLRYETRAPALFVHVCHCTRCQKSSGSAFTISMLIETFNVALTQGTPDCWRITGASGTRYDITRCADCGTALWGRAHGRSEALAFVRVGTLDEPDRAPPMAHIHVGTRQRWVALPHDIPCFEEMYALDQVWSPESLARFRILGS